MPLGFQKLSLKDDKKGAYPQEKLSEGVPPGAPPTNKEAPPSYAVDDPVSDTTGPSSEELNAAFAKLKLSDAPVEFPTADQCLAHLKLLSVFHVLKEDVGYTDGLFNLWDAKFESVDGRDEALSKMREKRWALYIARAVERFEDWWLKVLFNIEKGKRLETKDMVSRNRNFAEFTRRGRVQSWDTTMLPPMGKHIQPSTVDHTDGTRCPHGMACIHVKSSKLS